MLMHMTPSVLSYFTKATNALLDLAGMFRLVSTVDAFDAFDAFAGFA